MREDPRIGRSREGRVRIPSSNDEGQERQDADLGHCDLSKVVYVDLGPWEEQVRNVRKHGWRQDGEMN